MLRRVRAVRRSAIPLVLGVACMVAALAPARADVGSVVVVARGQFVPGDDDNGTTALVPQGYDIQFSNLDAFGLGPHTMTAYDPVTEQLLFDSGMVDYRESVVIKTSHLQAGTYRFICLTHYFRGTLQVI